MGFVLFIEGILVMFIIVTGLLAVSSVWSIIINRRFILHDCVFLYMFLISTVLFFAISFTFVPGQLQKEFKLIQSYIPFMSIFNDTKAPQQPKPEKTEFVNKFNSSPIFKD